MKDLRIIFLDIDGVLNNIYCQGMFENHYFVLEEKLNLLKELVFETDAKLVLTSEWRMGWFDIENGNINSNDARLFNAFQEKMKDYGLGLFSKTPILDEKKRGVEIDAWLKDWTGEKIISYVILDDLSGKELRPLSNRLVRTSFTKGLLPKHVAKAKKILNQSL